MSGTDLEAARADGFSTGTETAASAELFNDPLPALRVPRRFENVRVAWIAGYHDGVSTERAG